MSDNDFDWNELAFASKKPLRSLKATFIMAPRELSAERFKQLVKAYLPKGNIVLGLAKEEYIDDFQGQPHFKTLQQADVQSVINAVNKSKSPHKISTLHYSQRDVDFIVEKGGWQQIVLVRGSWHYAFHNRSTYYTLINNRLSYTMVSPFADEAEAQAFATKHTSPHNIKNQTYTAQDMMNLAARAAKKSFDYSFQTGVAIGKQTKDKYKFILTAHNAVVPYETYAMHHGAARETNFSPPNDLNHYDTVHAEIMAIIEAERRGLDLKNSTMFINLLPCPTCARALSQTDITEFIYREDHSDGYAVKMLELSDKMVRRLV